MGKQKFSAVIWFYLKHNSTESPQLEYVARNSNAQLHSDERDIVRKIAQLSMTIKVAFGLNVYFLFSFSQNNFYFHFQIFKI